MSPLSLSPLRLASIALVLFACLASLLVLHNRDLTPTVVATDKSRSSNVVPVSESMADQDEAMLLLPHLFTEHDIVDTTGEFSTLGATEEMDQLVVVAHYREDLSWLSALASPFKVIDKENPANPDNMNSNNMTEPNSYLYFLIKYYDVLPKQIAFVHGSGGHGSEHLEYGDHGDFVEGQAWIYNGYRPLNLWSFDVSFNTQQPYEGGWFKWLGGYETMPKETDADYDPTHEPYYLGAMELWSFMERDLASGGLGMTLPRFITDKCCSSFIVDRNTVRRIPRNILVRLLHFLETLEEGRTSPVGNMMEFAWKVLFNQAKWT